MKITKCISSALIFPLFPLRINLQPASHRPPSLLDAIDTQEPVKIVKKASENNREIKRYGEKHRTSEAGHGSSIELPRWWHWRKGFQREEKRERSGKRGEKKELRRSEENGCLNSELADPGIITSRIWIGFQDPKSDCLTDY